MANPTHLPRKAEGFHNHKAKLFGLGRDDHDFWSMIERMFSEFFPVDYLEEVILAKVNENMISGSSVSFGQLLHFFPIWFTWRVLQGRRSGFGEQKSHANPAQRWLARREHGTSKTFARDLLMSLWHPVKFVLAPRERGRLFRYSLYLLFPIAPGCISRDESFFLQLFF
jgi:hypothetical protein